MLWYKKKQTSNLQENFKLPGEQKLQRMSWWTAELKKKVQHICYLLC